jgi:hypothetical protein
MRGNIADPRIIKGQEMHSCLNIKPGSPPGVNGVRRMLRNLYFHIKVPTIYTIQP